jgi:hypothetical protein
MARPLLLVPSLVLLIVACGDGNGSNADDRVSAIYATTIRAVVADDEPDAESDVPVFVAPADPEAPISLGVQAGVVDQLHDFATIRFVDEPSEAIDEDDPARPVVEEGVLVTLGAVPERGDNVTVMAERYQTADSTRTFRVQLERADSTWTAADLSA